MGAAAPGATSAGTACATCVSPHPFGFDEPRAGASVSGAVTCISTPGTRAFASRCCAGYLAVIVAASPTVPAWHSHAANQLAPSYLPTTSAPFAVVALMSKSVSEMRPPSGLRGVSFPVESRNVIDTAEQEPIGSALTPGRIVTSHGPPLLAFGASHPGALPLLAPAAIGTVVEVVNETPGTRTFAAMYFAGYVAVTVATVPTGALGHAHTAK